MKIIFLVLALMLVPLVFADDSIYIVNGNELTKDNNNYKIVLNEKINNHSIDESNIYLSTNSFFYGFNNTNGSRLYKIAINNIQKIQLTENYIYVTNWFFVYQIDKTNGNILSKQNIINNDIFTMLTRSGATINNYYTCANCTNGINGSNGLNGTNGANGINGLNGTNGVDGVSVINTPVDFFLHTSNVMNHTFNLNSSIAVKTINNNVNGNTLLDYWLSPQLNVSYIPQGSSSMHITSNSPGGSGGYILRIYYDLYLTNSTGENLTLLSSSSYSAPLLSYMFSEDITAPVSVEQETNLTDRVLVKVYVNQTGSGSLPHVSFYYDDKTGTRLIMPLHQIEAVMYNATYNGYQSNITDLQNNKVSKSGDTMTGSITSLPLDGSCCGYGTVTQTMDVSSLPIRFESTDGSYTSGINLYPDRIDIFSSNGVSSTFRIVDNEFSFYDAPVNMHGNNINNCGNCIYSTYNSTYDALPNQTQLDTKVNKSGDIMDNSLVFQNASYSYSNLSINTYGVGHNPIIKLDSCCGIHPILYYQLEGNFMAFMNKDFGMSYYSDKPMKYGESSLSYISMYRNNTNKSLIINGFGDSNKLEINNLNISVSNLKGTTNALVCVYANGTFYRGNLTSC